MTASLAELEAMLPDLLPAHAVLGRGPDIDPDVAGSCDYLYVQGRIDRIHSFLLIEPGAEPDQAALGAFSETPSNWRWLVAPPTLVGKYDVVAEKYGCGLLSLVENVGLERVRHAPPNPGIFRKRYPNLRKAWKALSSW